MLVLTVNIVGEGLQATVGMEMKFKFVQARSISLLMLFSC